MTPELRVVRLRTGAEVHESVATTTTLALDSLMRSSDIMRVCAAPDAARLARDPSFPLPQDVADILRGLALIDSDGRMHDATRAVILACTEGEDFTLRLVSPFADDAPEASR